MFERHRSCLRLDEWIVHEHEVGVDGRPQFLQEGRSLIERVGSLATGLAKEGS